MRDCGLCFSLMLYGSHQSHHQTVWMYKYTHTTVTHVLFHAEGTHCASPTEKRADHPSRLLSLNPWFRVSPPGLNWAVDVMLNYNGGRPLWLFAISHVTAVSEQHCHHRGDLLRLQTAGYRADILTYPSMYRSAPARLKQRCVRRR
jgi:hypothetical protein